MFINFESTIFSKEICCSDNNFAVFNNLPKRFSMINLLNYFINGEILLEFSSFFFFNSILGPSSNLDAVKILSGIFVLINF